MLRVLPLILLTSCRWLAPYEPPGHGGQADARDPGIDARVDPDALADLSRVDTSAGLINFITAPQLRIISNRSDAIGHRLFTQVTALGVSRFDDRRMRVKAVAGVAQRSAANDRDRRGPRLP